MTQDKNTSFSLLTQQEIDTLVKFLTKTKIDSDVMNQNSIDKLIHLIRTDKDNLSLSSYLSIEPLDSSFIEERLHFRDSVDELCELHFTTNDEAKTVDLTIHNTKTDTTYPLTTDIINAHDTAGWGFCLAPSQFIQIAYLLSIKCTQDTYDTVCKTFAKGNYGSEDAKISQLYLPDSRMLVKVMI